MVLTSVNVKSEWNMFVEDLISAFKTRELYLGQKKAWISLRLSLVHNGHEFVSSSIHFFQEAGPCTSIIQRKFPTVEFCRKLIPQGFLHHRAGFFGRCQSGSLLALCCVLWYLHQCLWDSHNIVTSCLNSSEKQGITPVYRDKMSHSIIEKLGDLVEQGRVIPWARVLQQHEQHNLGQLHPQSYFCCVLVHNLVFFLIKLKKKKMFNRIVIVLSKSLSW